MLPSPAPLERFGLGDVEWQVSGVEVAAEGTGFWLRTPDATPIHVTLAVPGEHNALNAAAAIAALHAAAGVEPAEAAGALVGFAGVGRRFERRGTVAGASVVDDYAHHPTEVAATIKAARAHAPGRVLVCFQPHLYSRTEALARRFGMALATADEVVVTDIYPAREAPVEGVTGRWWWTPCREASPGDAAGVAADAGARRRAYLSGRLREGDLVLTVGAGRRPPGRAICCSREPSRRPSHPTTRCRG